MGIGRGVVQKFVLQYHHLRLILDPVLPKVGNLSSAMLGALAANGKSKRSGILRPHPQTVAGRLVGEVVSPAFLPLLASGGAQQPQQPDGAGDEDGTIAHIVGNLGDDEIGQVALLGDSAPSAAHHARGFGRRLLAGVSILEYSRANDDISPWLDMSEKMLAQKGQMEHVAAAGQHFEDQGDAGRGELIEGDGHLSVADGAVVVGDVLILQTATLWRRGHAPRDDGGGPRRPGRTWRPG